MAVVSKEGVGCGCGLQGGCRVWLWSPGRDQTPISVSVNKDTIITKRNMAGRGGDGGGWGWIPVPQSLISMSFDEDKKVGVGAGGCRTAHYPISMSLDEDTM